MTKYDEDALQALFDEVEAPASLEGSWLRPRVIRPARPSGAMRAAAAVVGVLTIGAVVFGVVASDRLAPSEDDPNLTITQGPTALSSPPTTTTAESAPPSSTGGAPTDADSAAPATQRTVGQTQAPPKQPGAPPIAPARGPLTEWPDAANAGVPPGVALRPHSGDLYITAAGSIFYDLRVDGTIYVQAPDVTLRRVHVAPRSGASAGVRQQAPRLRIEDSEIAGTQPGVVQEASGLTVQRSDISRASPSVVLTSDATVVDSFLNTVSTTGNSTRLGIRHNSVRSIAMADENGPVTEVTIENNKLGGGNDIAIYAPSGPGSQFIRIIRNEFVPTPGPPSTGWNGQAPGNTWSGNVWSGSGAPVDP